MRWKLLILAIVIIIIPLLLAFLRKPSSKDKNSTAETTGATASLSPTITLPPTETYVKNQLVIKYKSGMAPSEVTDKTKLQEIDAADKASSTLKKEKLYPNTQEPLSLFYVITLNIGANLQKAVSIYQSLPEVDRVQMNGVIKTNR